MLTQEYWKSSWECNFVGNSRVVQNVRVWMNSQPHLPNKFITDWEIILALHCCDNDIETTKQLIDRNFTLRSLFSFYKSRQVDHNLQNALNTWLISPISHPTTKGNRAIYCQLIDSDSAKFVYSDVVKAFVMIMDLWQYEEGPMSGVAVIVNMQNVSMGHISRIDLTVAQQFFYFLQEAMFVQLREFHFINAPTFIDGLLSMVRPFMKKEMLDMLKIHPVGSKNLDDCLPRDALPKEDEQDSTWTKIKLNEKFFHDESLKRVDENKRPEQSKTITSFFSGIEESFKKLEID